MTRTTERYSEACEQMLKRMCKILEFSAEFLEDLCEIWHKLLL